MNNNGERGFTLVEVVVVIAVVLLLTGIAVPMISSYVEDSKRARARSEVGTLAGSIASFYKDTATWPTRDSTGTNNVLYALYTGSTLPTSNPFLAGHNWDTWARSATRGDLLDNHLMVNEPQGSATAAYSTTGSNQWRGPYLPESSPLDPWARPYVVFVRSAFDASAVNYKKIIVLSAGLNGVIDTPFQAQTNQAITGDDIGVTVFLRP